MNNLLAELKHSGITPVSKTLAVDLVAKIGCYEHDKFEGIVYLGNNKLAVSMMMISGLEMTETKSKNENSSKNRKTG